jgi:hypothetical protein
VPPKAPEQAQTPQRAVEAFRAELEQECVAYRQVNQFYDKFAHYGDPPNWPPNALKHAKRWAMQAAEFLRSKYPADSIQQDPLAALELARILRILEAEPSKSKSQP